LAWLNSYLIPFEPGLLPWVDLLGYAASLFVLATFCMNTMLPLRLIAIGSNILFILFGYFASIYPVMILHIVLFPVNVVRLWQISRLVQTSVHAQGDGLSFQNLLPFMTKRHFQSGTTLVSKGDLADKLFYVEEGEVEIVELDKILASGAVIGEIGVFAPEHRRTATAKCKTDCIIYELSERKALELYFQNPSFGYAVLQLIISRLLENQQLKSGQQNETNT
jgi:CRP/FNR family transcriptional regulator, cyclic AMP receptor protein